MGVAAAQELLEEVEDAGGEGAERAREPVVEDESQLVEMRLDKVAQRRARRARAVAGRLEGGDGPGGGGRQRRTRDPFEEWGSLARRRARSSG